MKNPKVSVLMPAYNAEKYIGEAIDSILNQSFKDFEFIIIDDCSLDKTWKIIKKYQRKDKRIVALKNTNNLKICQTLNRGIKEAKGKYIVRMDADDWSFPDRIKKQFEYMDHNKKVAISGGSMIICNSNLKAYARRSYPSEDMQLRKIIFRFSPFSHPTVIFKTDIAKKIGGYGTLYAEDIEFYLNMRKYGKFGNLDDDLIKYREVATSMTREKLKITEINTLRHRIKAVVYLNYRFTFLDFIYNLAHFISIFIVPQNIKMYLFSKFRNKKIE